MNTTQFLLPARKTIIGCCVFLMMILSVFQELAGQKTLTWTEEQHRPQFHFSPEKHWMNDPNGLVFYDGEYHLFYQYYPEATVWGPMHWGHAVSRNLIHWSHLPIAIYPDSLGYIFSGSIVIDHQNASRLSVTPEHPPMVAIFTHHDPQGEKTGTQTFQSQSVAWSADRGRTFQKYQYNPVIQNPGIRDFRDPKVIWHRPSAQWILVLAAYDKVMIYGSKNLTDWNFFSSFGVDGDHRLWECPDLFPIKVEKTGEEKWVLITSIQKGAPNGGTGTSYFVGDFDGKNFIADPSAQQWLDYGTDNYAMVTWSNITDGRTLAMGWMSNWQYAQQVPTKNWRSAMTLPRELTLHKIGNQYKLYTMPVKELEQLYQTNLPVYSGHVPSDGLLYQQQTLSRILVSAEESPASEVKIQFSNALGEELVAGFDPHKKTFYIDRSNAGESNFFPGFASRHESDPVTSDGPFVWEILLDQSSVEIFGMKGECAMTDIFFPTKPFSAASIVCQDADRKNLKIQVNSMNSIWKDHEK